MKKTVFQKFASKYLIPEMPGFTVQGNLVYQMPIGPILRAFLFDSSDHDTQTFNPTAFVQPLYVPSDHIVMNIGERLPGVWQLQRADDPVLGSRLVESMKAHGNSLFDSWGKPEKIAANSEGCAQSTDYYRVQACAYSLVWIGKTQKALQVFDRLLTMLKIAGSFQEWALEVYARVAELRSALIRDPVEAKALLGRWLNQTKGTLKLPA